MKSASPGHQANIVHLLSDHLRYDVSGMDVNGADGHNLLPVTLCELSNQHRDEGVELGHLFPIVLLESILIALIHAGKGNIYIGSPPDLSACQCHLEQQIRNYIVGLLLETINMNYVNVKEINQVLKCCYMFTQKTLGKGGFSVTSKIIAFQGCLVFNNQRIEKNIVTYVFFQQKTPSWYFPETYYSYQKALSILSLSTSTCNTHQIWFKTEYALQTSKENYFNLLTNDYSDCFHSDTIFHDRCSILAHYWTTNV